jgi:hypothetical protein
MSEKNKPEPPLYFCFLVPLLSLWRFYKKSGSSSSVFATFMLNGFSWNWIQGVSLKFIDRFQLLDQNSSVNGHVTYRSACVVLASRVGLSNVYVLCSIHFAFKLYGFRDVITAGSERPAQNCAALSMFCFVRPLFPRTPRYPAGLRRLLRVPQTPCSLSPDIPLTI